MDNNLLYVICLLLFVNFVINWKDKSKVFYFGKDKHNGITLNALIILACFILAIIVLVIN